MGDLPQCWAYNHTGRRCEQRAGHASKHSYTISWDDDECYNPVTQPPQPVLAAINQAMTAVAQPPVVATEQPAAKKCVACSHMHRGGECKCGCHEHIG